MLDFSQEATVRLKWVLCGQIFLSEWFGWQKATQTIKLELTKEDQELTKEDQKRVQYSRCNKLLASIFCEGLERNGHEEKERHTCSMLWVDMVDMMSPPVEEC